MIVASNLAERRRPTRENGARLVASVDVEWTKNYRVRNGNRPFCYSIVWIEIPNDGTPTDLAACSFSYTSAYAEAEGECFDLVEHTARDLAAATREGDRLVGHQLCADLGVLAAHTAGPAAAMVIERTRQLWHLRRDVDDPLIIDTRYDTDSLLTGKSRRLVDICTELDLDVTQPELRSRSMTALHRQWLADSDPEARERITVLNLRHSLSAALVALRALGAGTWTGQLNVNRILDQHLRGTFAWVDHPTFRALLDR